MPRTEADHEALNLGREAALALRCMESIIMDMTTEIMQNAVGAHRGGELTGERALVAWGKIDAIWGLRETLENRVLVGEAAATRAAGQQGS